MRKTLLTTVAAAAVIGFAAVASAQDTGEKPGGAGGAKSHGGATQSETKGETKGPAGGAMMQKPGAEQKPAQSAQTPVQGGKTKEQMGQTQGPKEAMPQRGAQEEKRGTEQKLKGAQEEKFGTEQKLKGAQEEKRGTEQKLKGAQEEKRGTQQFKGAEEGKGGVSTTQQNAQAPARGGAVQLSQTQRTRIQAIVGRNSTARVRTNVNFDVAVGVRVPRTIHVEVLPREIVEIVPQFEGFDYIIVGDNILIIDPRTMEIVDIIPA